MISKDMGREPLGTPFVYSHLRKKDVPTTRSNSRNLACKLYAYILGRLRLPDAEALIEEAAV